jgi:uncharacterized protein
MTDAQLKELLETHRTIAVVGLSPNPDRPSHSTTLYMQRMGYRIIPVNPGQTQILGERCYASLSEIPFDVNIVNVFRNEEDVLPIAQQAIAKKAQCLWQQLGIANQAADALVRGAGLTSVMDHCIKIEHRRLAIAPWMPDTSLAR